MAAEWIAVVTVGLALATFIRVSFKDLCNDLAGRLDRIETRLERLETRLERLETRLERLEARVAVVEHGQAKLEGLLEGLREAMTMTGRRASGDAA